MQNDSLKGTLLVIITYICWGLLSIFWALLGDVNPFYVLSNRILWSMVILAVYFTVSRNWKEIQQVFKSSKMIFTTILAGLLVTINWGTYIYAINRGHVLDASMGYFLEPVLVAAVGMIAFKEKPSILEKITFGFSIAALCYIIIQTKTFPVLSIAIGLSFAFYGAVKKFIKLGANAGLFMETFWMTLPAFIFCFVSEKTGNGVFGILPASKMILLPMCGLVTLIPLILFSIGVKKLPYYLSGILMYINPTLQFLVGLFYFKEELNTVKLTAFIIIWVGLLFTVADKIRLAKKS